MNDPAVSRVWVVMPAAGVGHRMRADIPKQYLPLLGRPVIRWSLETLLAEPRVAGAVVALGEFDRLWEGWSSIGGKAIHPVTGGAERADSVREGLRFLSTSLAGPNDWVLVHDAVRPCVSPEAIARLLDLGLEHPDGALLAEPVRDTLKRSTAQRTISATATRDGLWCAQTPQLFPLIALLRALDHAHEADVQVTDEAQAMERAGHSPLLVEGGSTNIKITRPADLPLAASILTTMQQEPEA